MKMKFRYHCEQATGANPRSTAFSFFDAVNTIEEARESVRSRILAQIDRKDRGDDYEQEWKQLADEAAAAEPGDVISFDEHHWRIICGGDDD